MRCLYSDVVKDDDDDETDDGLGGRRFSGSKTAKTPTAAAARTAGRKQPSMKSMFVWLFEDV